MFLKYVQCGWPRDFEPSFDPFASRKQEMSIEQEYLVWLRKIVTSPKAKKLYLHEVQLGVPCMKALVRSYVWSPGMDKGFENLFYSCENAKLIRQCLRKLQSIIGK